MDKPQGLRRRTGVVLRRDINPEGDIRLLCLFRSDGIQWLSLPGGGRGRVRLGGSTEPLVWGEFSLYKGRNRSFLKEVEVKRDFWSLRGDPESLKSALCWCRFLSDILPYQHSVDEIIPVLFWSLDLLEKKTDPCGTDFRFIWRILKTWGVAPALDRCGSCGKNLLKGTWRDGVFLCPRCSDGKENGVDLRLADSWAVSPRENLAGKSLSVGEHRELDIVRRLILKNFKVFR